MNQVRIIGGQWRRQLLRFVEGEGLRPTPDRVRETLFNWLGQDLTGQTCLDLFAGSGALGFEAASRGAEQVLLLERNPKVAVALKENINRLQAGAQVQVRAQDALKFAATCDQVFDVVFADPPYNQGWLQKLEPYLSRILKEDGLLYVEAESPVMVLGEWQSIRQGRAGQSYFHLLQREPNL